MPGRRCTPATLGSRAAESDLLSQAPTLTQRIDLALFTAPFSVEDIHRIGISPSNKTDTGLWPSDHSGLVATFALPAPEPTAAGLFVVGLAVLGAIRRRRRAVAILSAMTLTMPLALPASAATYSSLFAFGDSLSDAGNAFVATGGTVPAPPYSGGRFSNGPVWVQDLAAKLGLGSLGPSLLGGNDYAVGGAQTGTTPVHAAGPGDLPAELAAFATTHPTAPSGALYTLAIGANDLFTVLQSANPLAVASATIAAAIGNIDAVVADLAAVGARDFVIMTSPDLGLTPSIAASGPAASMFATTLTASFNSGLVASINALAATDGLDVRMLDAFGLLDEEVANPATFGFTDVTTPCWTGTYFGTGGTLCTTSPSGQDAHLFWDAVHPTEAGHAALADAALRAIPEPPGALLWLGALATLAVVQASATRRPSGR